MKAKAAPRLAVSVGCPSGIGPEVSVKAAAGLRGARALLVGDLASLRAAAALVGVDRARLVRVRTAAEGFAAPARALPVLEVGARLAAADRRPGAPTAGAGRAQLAWIDAATDLVARGEADALVTGPASKEAVVRGGAAAFRGHTEHLAARLGASEPTMAFWSPTLTVSLVTTHLPIAKVPRAVTRARVARAILHTARFVASLRAPGARAAGASAPPRLAVAGLNPHAGEGGLLGGEELRAVAPGLADAEARLAREGVRVDVTGPLPAEAALRLGAAGRYDAVVCMFHDQATIAAKLLGFGESVNVTLGLPILRTSVDHGTGYDLAGTGRASADGMRAALALGAALARRA